MNFRDVLSTSPHYLFGQLIWATSENFNLDLNAKRFNCFHVVDVLCKGLSINAKGQRFLVNLDPGLFPPIQFSKGKALGTRMVSGW